MGLLAEPERLHELRSYGVLDAPPDPRLDDLARAAALACGVPVALVSLVDKERQFFLARVGFDAVETPRKNAFCNQAIGSEGLFQVQDALLDGRFRAHPMVVQDPHIRFYAAAPLVTPGRAALGTLCVIDWKPGALTAEQGKILQILGREVIEVLEQRRRAAQRSRVQQALDGDLRSHLQDVVRQMGKLRGPAGDLTTAMLASDAALQTLDDALDLLDAQGSGLRRQSADLAVACRDLAACYQLPGRPPLLFSATGDCRGLWDVDRLTRALDALLERAGGPVGVSVRGLAGAVEITVRASSIPEAGLRVDAAQQIVRAHGGSVQRATAGGAVSVMLLLPR